MFLTIKFFYSTQITADICHGWLVPPEVIGGRMYWRT
jgi:hypothetical protein